MQSNVLKEILRNFIWRKEVIAAALIGTDGLIIESASKKNIDMDRFSALFGIYFANTAGKNQNIRLLPLPKHEEASYVLLANVSGALLALFTNDECSTDEMLSKFKNDIQQVEHALSKEIAL